MKALVGTQYGSPDVLHVQEVAKPTPQGNEVLVQVHAVSVNAADLHALSGKPFLMRLMGFGLLKPKNTILGAAIAGRIEAIGASVTQFQPGDEVFGDLSGSGWGGFAEYVCAREDVLVLKPTNLTFEQAAAVPVAAITALQGLRDKGQIQAGQKVLIYGASGGVGTFAVQLAKSFGAEVTAVCSTGNVDLLRSLGADHVIDYTQEDFTHNGQQYDLILAANGDQALAAYQRALRPHGTYVMTGGSAKQMFQAMLLGPWISRTGNQKMGNLLAKPNTRDLGFVKGLLEAGQVVPVIDRGYPLSAGVEAIRYLGKGHAKGKVVISMEPRRAAL
jgi:NADPH:quinone reductase-like Zn-dependent oxidoreductase